MKGMGHGSVGWAFSARSALALLLVLGTTLLALAGQLGPRTNYSADEIATAVRNSNLNPTLMADADQMGNLGRFESSGNGGINNGSCCTGVFQLNGENLRNAGLTPTQYANMSLQDQTNVWANLTNSGMNAGPVRQLNGMTTFDGQPVDGAMKMACIQLGTGNCQKMLRSGSCSGFADKNGTTICDMAQSIRDGKRGKASGKGGCTTPSDSGKKDGDGSGEKPPEGQKNTTVPCKSATSNGGGASGTCDANMKLQSGIQCSNFTGSLVSFCEQYKPKLMTRSDCDSAEKYAQGAKKGDRETECKNQTFGRGTKSWSYVLACSGTPSNQGEKGNGKGTTPGSGTDNKTSTDGGNGNGDNNGTNTNGGTSDGTSTNGGSSGSTSTNGDGSTSGSGSTSGDGSTSGSGSTGSGDGSTSGGGSGGTGDGSSSGATNSDGLTRADMDPYRGQVVGTNGECVSLSKSLGTDENGNNLGPASGWRQGTTITSDNYQQYMGEAVATSNDNGQYARNGGYHASDVAAGVDGAVYSHTGILAGWDSSRNAPILFDQYNGAGAGYRTANVGRYGNFSTIRQ